MIRLLLFLLGLFITRPFRVASLSSDGYLLLSFKRLVLSDPLFALSTWNENDATPCQWNGVNCTDFFLDSSWTPRVTSILLPNSKLLGSIPANLTAIDTLQKLDLSHNFLNGTLPPSLFNASDLRFLSLSNNELYGELPDVVAGLKSLEFLNLSDNALSGRIPASAGHLPDSAVRQLPALPARAIHLPASALLSPPASSAARILRPILLYCVVHCFLEFTAF